MTALEHLVFCLGSHAPVVLSRATVYYVPRQVKYKVKLWPRTVSM